MSLLGPVYVILSLSKRQEDALVQGAQALVGLEGSLTALVARLGPEVTPEQQAQVDALMTQLQQSGETLQAAEDAAPKP